MRTAKEELHRARQLVLRYGWNTMAYQILNPGISLWFSEHRDAVIGYVETKTHCIIAGSPVAERKEIDDVVLEFYRYVSTLNKKVCFFGAQERIASILAKRAPVSSILLGAQPVWKPAAFLSAFHSKQSLRAQVHRAKNKHVTAEVWSDRSVITKQALHECLQEWISARHLPPMHFLVEPNTLEALDDRVVVAAHIDGAVVGFCIASPIPLRKGWLIEQIVRRTTAPNGTAELMLEKMITTLHDSKANLITLGLSPLSHHYSSPFRHPFWLNTMLQCTRLYGRWFYNFDGLDSFKAKFNPTAWEPVYAVTNEKSPSFSTLYAIATAFSGISPVTFVAKGMMKMVIRK